MKHLSLISALLLTATLAHAGSSELQKIDSNSAKLIVTSTDTNQAANFVDATSNKAFLDLMMKDPKSILSDIKARIEKDESCSEDQKKDSLCGEVQIQGPVLNTFGRSGWASADASYRYLIGFREAGTGHFFQATYTLEVSEEVESTGDADSRPKGKMTKAEENKFTKTLTLRGARDITKDELNIK